MKNYLRLALLALVLVAALGLLASCGGSGGGAQGNGSGGDMEGMDHGGSGEQATNETTSGGMAGMDHGDMGGMDHGSMMPEDMAREMVAPNGEYSDERFIDAMVPHHQGAVEMAEVALENAEHEQIRRLAEDIITAQQAEIEELKQIKEQEYGTSEVPMEMSQEEMRAMGMTADPQELANQEPFDLRFIDAMIPHHQSAIEMAKIALEESKNPQIRQIAEDIVSSQEREIDKMLRWRSRWYPGD
jgi:uncharacterized protein (DUF305 family)